MSTLTNPRSFRRMLAGLGLALGAVLLLATELVHPEPSMDASEQLAVIVANKDRWYLAHALALVALALAIPAVLALMHLLRATRPALGHLGATLTFLGMLPLAALVGMEFVLWQAGGLPPANVVPLFERLNDSAGILLLYLFALLFPIGVLVLGTGLYLARTVPRWQAALIGAGIPIVFVGDLATEKIITIVGALMYLAGALPLGLRVLAQTDEEWERGIEVAEFRPVPTG